MKTAIKELRISLTVENMDELIQFYRDEIGLNALQIWCTETGRGIVLDAGRATLELVNKQQSTFIDQLEAGKVLNDSIRLAFRVDTPGDKAYALLKGSASLAAPPTYSLAGEVARIQAPDGMQITLFSEEKREPGLAKKQDKPGTWMGKICELLSLYK